MRGAAYAYSAEALPTRSNEEPDFRSHLPASYNLRKSRRHCARACVASAAKRFLEHVQRNMPEGGLLVFKLSPYKTSKSPSQPGGGRVPPSAAGLRWIVKQSVRRIGRARFSLEERGVSLGSSGMCVSRCGVSEY